MKLFPLGRESSPVVFNLTESVISHVVPAQQGGAAWPLKKGAAMKSYFLGSRLPAMVAALLLFLMQPAQAFVITTYYVATNGNDAAAGTNWATAVRTIQVAVDKASTLDNVLVSNGVYATGGRDVPGYQLTNRVYIDKPIPVQSVNGPAVTTIRGAWDPSNTNGPLAVRCVWMTNGATLSGFTLTNGATFVAGNGNIYGGGVFAQSTLAVISNCVITGNRSFYEGGGSYDGTFFNCTLSGNRSLIGGGSYTSTLVNCTLTGNRGQSAGGSYYGTLINCTLSGNVSDYAGGGAIYCTLNNCTLSGNVAASGGGGGAADCTLNNCTLVGNVADLWGGGSFGGTLNNCTIVSNTAGVGGGSYVSSLNNCIVYFNTASPDYYANYVNGAVSNTCTTPLVFGGGNISNNPQFVDAVNSNFLLTAGSPCRDTGNNNNAPAGPDLAGNPRIVNTVVDMGAYEYQAGPPSDYDGDGMPSWWETLNGQNPVTNDTASDTDTDGQSAIEEYIAGTQANDSNSFFHIDSISIMSPPEVKIDTVVGRLYAADYNDNLAAAPQVWTEFTNNIPGTGNPIIITDPLATNRNFRIRVQLAP